MMMMMIMMMMMTNNDDDDDDDDDDDVNDDEMMLERVCIRPTMIRVSCDGHGKSALYACRTAHGAALCR